MRVEGQCHCGAIAYDAEVEPGTIGICSWLSQPREDLVPTTTVGDMPKPNAT
jgi:hypothetical protein